MLEATVIRNEKRCRGGRGKKKPVREQILALLATNPDSRWYWRVIADCLGYSTQRQRWVITSALKNMTNNGKLVRVRRGFYGLQQEARRD